MKATFEIPDDLYRRVKARTALEGRPLRSVAVQLFQEWLNEPATKGVTSGDSDTSAHGPTPPWLAITRRYVRPGMNHDLEAMRSAIKAGWANEVTGKLSGK